jgi:hypothetical protein
MLPHRQLPKEREMKRWGLTIGVAMAAAFSTFGAASASAASEFGDNCTANQTTTASVPATLFALTAANDPLPLAAPSGGVITKWSLNQVAVGGVTVPQTLKVLRLTGPKSVQVIGESAQTITGGANSFETRIPVQAGDRLGISGFGEKGLVYCLEEPGPKNLLGIFANTGGIGSVGSFEPIEAEARAPATAVLEPDADNDGYGDETQDKCPTSAATHDACPAPVVVPPVTLNTQATAKKGLAKILVTSSTQTQVTVAGTIKLGKHTTMTLRGGTQVVNPGTFASFVLLFPKALKEKLRALSPKQSLTLTVTATAPNSAGAVTTNEFKVKLKGQAKPVSRKGKGKRG